MPGSGPDQHAPVTQNQSGSLLAQALEGPYFLRALVSLVSVGALFGLLLLYIQRTRVQFSGFSARWAFYTFVRLMGDVRDNRLYEPILTYGAFAAAWFIARRIVRRLAIAEPLSRLLAFAFLFYLALLIPFHLLAFISFYGDLPCLHPYNILLILLAALFLTKLLVPPAAPPPPVSPQPIPALAWLISRAGWCIFIAMAVIMAALTQQAYRGFDALWYHLPTAMNWHDWRKSAGLNFHFAFQFPANAEVMVYYLVNAHALPLLAQNQFLAAVLASLATIRIGRLFRFENWASLLAGSAFLLVPVTLNQALILGNDIFLGALLLLTICFLLEAHVGDPKRTRAWLALAALAYGAALGTKYNSIFLGPVFAAWFLWIVFSRIAPRRRARMIALIVLLAAIPCAFWFCRNWSANGNPLYPFRVSLLGHVIFPGDSAQEFRLDKQADFVSKSSQWFYYPFVENIRWAQSWGATFAVFMYLLPLMPLVLAIRRRRESPQLAAAYLFAFMLIAAGLLSWAAMTSREPRFIFFLYGLVLSFAAGLMSIGPLVFRRAMGLLFCATLAVNLSFLTSVISERYWLETDHISSELTLPGFEQAINAQPPATVLSAYSGRYAFMLYGDQLQHRVLHSNGISAEQLKLLQPDMVAIGRKPDQPPLPELANNPAYRLLCDASSDKNHYYLYQRLAPRPKPAVNLFTALRPTAILASSTTGTTQNVIDGNLSTGWVAGREANPFIEMTWPAPIDAGWLQISWIKLDYEKYRVFARSDGKWEKVASMKHPAMGKSKAVVDRISLHGRGFDGLRIQAVTPKTPGNPVRSFNLVEVTGLPAFSFGDVVLALGLILGLAATPFEPRAFSAIMRP